MAKDQTISNEEYTRRVEWLRRYRQALQDERRLRERLDEAHARAESTARALLGTPAASNRGGDRTAAAVDMIVRYQEQLAQKIRHSEEIRLKVKQAIDRLENPMLRRVLQLRYIDGLPHWKAAQEMYISEEWAKKLHRRAVCGMELPAGKTKGEDQP